MTEPPMPAAPARPAREAGRGKRPWGIPFVGLSIAGLAAIAALALLPAKLVASKRVEDPERAGRTIEVETPYALVPAAAQPVADRVSYGELGADISVDTDPDGRVYFVTVSEPAQSILGHWVGENEPEVEFTTHEEKYGTQTPTQQRSEALRMMHTSAQVAQYFALVRAGYDADIVPRVLVAGPGCAEIVDERCAREGVLREELEVNDEILRIDGDEVGTSQEIGDALADRKPGDIVELTYRRDDGEPVTIDIELIESPLEDGRAIIGIMPFETASVELPFEMEIDTGEIGGPSAGLAFTLTLIDELTEGDLLGGRDVAVTGTIELDGSVGAIGGLPQKASAVRQAGVDYFLVPAGQSQESLAAAREVVGDDVELIPVATVDDALAALEELGGDPLPD